jgi:hypothetical protein
VDQNGSLSTKGRLTRPGPTVPGDWWETFYLLLNHLVSLPREQVGGQGFFFTFAECDFPETEIGADAIALPGVDFGSQRKLPLLHNRSLLTHKLGYLP